MTITREKTGERSEHHTVLSPVAFLVVKQEEKNKAKPIFDLPQLLLALIHTDWGAIDQSKV